MFARLFWAPAALAVAVMASGCASTSEVKVISSGYKASAKGSWLIKVESPEEKHRLMWEQQCVKHWQKEGLDGQAAHQVLGEQNSNENTLNRAAEEGFDHVAILDITSLLLNKPSYGDDTTNTVQKDFSQGESSKLKTYGDQADVELPNQQLAVELFALDDDRSATRLDINTHEANDLKKISNSQCQAVAEYIKNLP